MKPLIEYININEAKHSPQEYKDAARAVEEHIGKLEDMLSSTLGLNMKLKVEMVGPQQIDIASDNILPQSKDKVWPFLFSKVRFSARGSINNDGSIVFIPCMYCETAGRGSTTSGLNLNGMESIVLNPQTNEWFIK